MSSKVDLSYKRWATETQLDRLQGLMSHIDGVREAEDIEAVHQMRVYSRRLRAGFDIFGDAFDKKKRRLWNGEIRRVTKSLGHARDLDVQIEFLEALIKKGTENTNLPGIERLMLRLQQKRTKVQPSVIRAMDRLENSGVLDDMMQNWRQFLVKVRLEHVSQRSPFIYERAYEGIMIRIEELLVLDTVVYQPEQIEQHHEMRIDAKKLRYILEGFEGLYDKQLSPFLKSVKKIQAQLGDMHDCDVWTSWLPEFIEDERERTETFFGHARGFKRIEKGLLAMIEMRQNERDKVYKNFRDDWTKLHKQNFWQQLREVLYAFKTNPPVDSEETIYIDSAAAKAAKKSKKKAAKSKAAPTTVESAPVTEEASPAAIAEAPTDNPPSEDTPVETPAPEQVPEENNEGQN